MHAREDLSLRSCRVLSQTLTLRLEFHARIFSSRPWFSSGGVLSPLIHGCAMICSPLSLYSGSATSSFEMKSLASGLTDFHAEEESE